MQLAVVNFAQQNRARWIRAGVGCVVAIAVACSGIAWAANQSVQGAKKEEGGFDIDAPNAILIDADSGSVLFEKNADQPTAPSTMQHLMTLVIVFDKLA